MAEKGEGGSQGTGHKLGVWLGALSAFVTVGLTGLNAYWSREISTTEQALKARAAELEEKKLELEKTTIGLAENKDRIARYVFVQSLFGSMLGDKEGGSQQTLAVNLISLALTQEEAAKLFAGFQRSNDKRVQELGNIGTDLVGVKSLVAQINAPTLEARQASVRQLVKDFKSDPQAVDAVLTTIESPQLEALTAGGRANALYFLIRTEKSAWTPELLRRADAAIANVKRRHETGVAALGAQSQGWVNDAAAHLDKVRKP